MDPLAGSPNAARLPDTLRPNTSNSTTSGRKPSHGFLHKWFSRQPSMPDHANNALGDHAILPQLDSTEALSRVDMKVTPCPYIHPLANRMEPRIESSPGVARRVRKDSEGTISRKSEEPPHAAHNSLSAKETREDSHGGNILTLDSMSINNSMLPQDIATAATLDARYLEDWDYYIKCYSEGRYSLTVPPRPPPRNPNFTYLPCTYPPNEPERLSTFKASHRWSGSRIVWSSSEAERARGLIMAATTKFKTPWAAISFFDQDTEIIQAKLGYPGHLVSRHESIASHVLLTDEVMTVLDTRKDWRFSGNPLVVGNPNIRFFAGAPLLSEDSQVIGVFSIFGPEPRASFTAMQRRDLLGFSESATQQLTVQKGPSSSTDLQIDLPQNPAQDLHSPSRLHNPSSRAPPSHSVDSSKNATTTLRYHEVPQNHVRRSRLIIDLEGRDGPVRNRNDTPPSSDDSDMGCSPVLAETKGFGKNPKQLSLAAIPKQAPSDIKTPESPDFGDLSPDPESLQPRGSSLSDLDDLDLWPEPLPTDLFHKNNTNESVATFKGSQMDRSLDSAANILDSPFYSPTEHVRNTPSLSISSEGGDSLLEELLLLGEDLGASYAPRTELIGPSTLERRDDSSPDLGREATTCRTDKEARSSSSSDSNAQITRQAVAVSAEAKFAADLWAKSLEFDAIYAVELVPMKNGLKPPEMTGSNDVEAHILVSHGLPDPVNLDIPIHLDVLRRSGAITWVNKNATPNEYARGFMMPLLFKRDALDHRSCGVVFGAFRRKPENLRSADVERLQRAANVLEGILTKSPSLSRSSQSEIDCLSLSQPQPYPANEAIEVSKISYDAGVATFARRKGPKTPVKWQLGSSD